MHEWALAESIISAAVHEMKKNHLKTLKEITIQIGELQQIERDIFRFALKEIMNEKHMTSKNIKLHIKTERARLRCIRCGYSWGLHEILQNTTADEAEAIHFIPEVALVHTRCPHCGSPDFEIKKGRGVTITSLKGTG